MRKRLFPEAFMVWRRSPTVTFAGTIFPSLVSPKRRRATNQKEASETTVFALAPGYARANDRDLHADFHSFDSVMCIQRHGAVPDATVVLVR